MSFILPNWIPRDPTILEGCINEEMKRLLELQEEISKIESKSANPFVFKNPSPDAKLPCSMTMKLLNTLIYKTNIIDFDYSYDIRKPQIPTVYIATTHEIHSFQIPISKNNPIIKVPDRDIEIKSIAIFPESIVALFNNNYAVPYSLLEHTWKNPITIPFKQEINTLKRFNDLIFFQTGPNKISVFNSTKYQLVNWKDLKTQAILECYFPDNSNDGYFKTIEKDVIVVNIETMRVLHTVSLYDMCMFKLAIQSYGNSIFAYNDEATLKYTQNFQLDGQFDFGTTLMHAEFGLIFFLSETSQSQLLSENESQPKENKADENYTEEEENDVNISLSIASIQTGEVLAVLSISHLNIVSFKIIYTKLGERYIIIRCDDNSLSFWNFTFEVPQKDEHGRAILQRIEEENTKVIPPLPPPPPPPPPQPQPQMLFADQNQTKAKISLLQSAFTPVVRPMLNNKATNIINAPISPVNQATNVNLVSDSQNGPALQPQMNILASPKIQHSQTLQQQSSNTAPHQIINISNNTRLNENQKITQNTSSAVQVTNTIQKISNPPNQQNIGNINVTPSNTTSNNTRQVLTHKYTSHINTTKQNTNP